VGVAGYSEAGGELSDTGRRYDRRTFLARGAGSAAALAVAGVGGPTMLSASTQPGIGIGGPRRGGTINVGMNSEIDGFLPSASHFDNTGITYASTVFDSLTVRAANGEARPYLAQSVTSNPDYTTWTITLRPNVTFHDSSPLTADVVVANFQAIRSSALTGQAVKPISGVKAVGDLQVVFTCNEPLVAFPQYLATQLGYVVALSQLESSNSTHPIGTGPFRYVSWVPNDHFTVEANPNYWRRGVPYLDGITFRPIIDDDSRQSSLLAGTIDLMVSHDPNAIATLRRNSSFQLVDDLNQSTGQPDMDFICLNVTAPPLNDLTVRQALAHATNAKEIVKLFGAGVTPVTSSLYPPGSPYRPAHNGYPTYDLAKAKRLVAQAAPRHGGAIKLTLGDIPDPRQLEIIQALQSMWMQAGFHVSLTDVQQVTYIDNLVTGNFQAYADEQFSAADPDLNYVWLSETTASGPIALNFARNKDPKLEAALQHGRTHADPAVRAEAYQTVDKLLAKDLPYLWLSRAPWSMSASNKVQNFAGPTLPSGGRAEGFRAGTFTTSQIWLKG
jgi:peptide/nickel transport system substrate-binding protein